MGIIRTFCRFKISIESTHNIPHHVRQGQEYHRRLESKEPAHAFSFFQFYIQRSHFLIEQKNIFTKMRHCTSDVSITSAVLAKKQGIISVILHHKNAMHSEQFAMYKCINV